jgi:LuxR family transcriptional regulator, maltose regulon positive regulatory protein
MNMTTQAAGGTIIGTRITVPRIPAARLVRPQLEQALRTALQHRLTFVQAPAGYGKTTLAAAVLADLQPAWVTLTAGDDDPARLLLVLTAALQPLIPDTGPALSVLINAGRLDAAVELLTQHLNGLTASAVVVLDDLQLLTQPVTHDLLAKLIAYGLPRVHWLLLSRHALPFSAGRLQLQDELATFDAADLQLSPPEIAEFLRCTAGLTLEQSALEQLAARTQGWPAAIKLATLSWQRAARHLAGQAPDDYLLQHAGVDNRLLAEYLVDEVLAEIPDMLRQLLLLSALVDRLHPELCTHLLDDRAGAELLLTAYRRGMFLQPLGAIGEWFVMHALFRELLQRRLHQLIAPEMIRAAGQRAAAWLAARGEIVSALQCLREADAGSAAADLVERHARPALLAYRLVDLAQWLDLLDEQLVAERPPLLIIRAWLQYFTGAATLMPATIAQLQSVLPADAGPALIMETIVLQQVAQSANGERRLIFQQLAEHEAQLSAADPFVRGWAWFLMAICFRNDEAARFNPRSLLQQSREAFARSGAAFAELYVRVAEVMIARNAGDTARVIDLCQDGLVFARAHPELAAADEAIESFAILSGEALFWTDRTAQAQPLFELVYASTLRTQNVIYQRQALLWLHLCQAVLQPQQPPALPAADGWTTAADLTRIGRGELTILLHLTSLYYHLQAQRPAGRAAERVQTLLQLTRLSAADVDPTTTEGQMLGIMTATVIANTDPAQTAARLEQFAALLDQRNSPLGALHLAVLRVVCLRRSGQHAAARADLRRLLPELAARSAFRLPLLFPELLPVLRAIDHDVARQLLERAERSAQPTSVSLTLQELAILRRLAQGKSTAVIAAELILARSTVKWHLTRIYRKLGVNDAAAAVTWFTTYEQLTPEP